MGQLQRWPAWSTSAMLAITDRIRTILNPCDVSFCNNERSPSTPRAAGRLRGSGRYGRWGPTGIAHRYQDPCGRWSWIAPIWGQRGSGGSGEDPAELLDVRLEVA